MAYSTLSYVITGQTWSAAEQNQIKSNFDAIWPIIKARQGISSASWVSTSTGALNNYTPANFSIQAGSLNTALSSSTITFPANYTYPPVIFITPYNSTNTASVTTISTASFILVLGSTVSTIINWIAFGE